MLKIANVFLYMVWPPKYQPPDIYSILSTASFYLSMTTPLIIARSSKYV